MNYRNNTNTVRTVKTFTDKEAAFKVYSASIAKAFKLAHNDAEILVAFQRAKEPVKLSTPPDSLSEYSQAQIRNAVTRLCVQGLLVKEAAGIYSASEHISEDATVLRIEHLFQITPEPEYIL